MSFLDKFKQQTRTVAGAAGGVAQNAVKQTKSLAAVGRIKLAITSEEDKMKKAYTELGRLFYRDYEAQTEAVMDDYQPWCDKIADAKAQIERLNAEIEKVRANEPEAIDDTVPDAGETVEKDFAEPAGFVAEAAEAAEETVDTAVEEIVEPAEKPDLPEFEVFGQEPTVDTLYVDVTDTEE